MEETYTCPNCGNIQRKVVRKEVAGEVTRFILDCKHEYRRISRVITENVRISDNVTISFDTEEDRSKGFSVLMASGLSFNGLGKNKFIVTPEQSLLLQNQKINYKRVD
jgi:hypothetical protein